MKVEYAKVVVRGDDGACVFCAEPGHNAFQCMRYRFTFQQVVQYLRANHPRGDGLQSGETRDVDEKLLSVTNRMIPACIGDNVGTSMCPFCHTCDLVPGVDCLMASYANQ